jgi:hypothetical protein
MFHNPNNNDICIGTEHLSIIIALLGRSPRDLLTDDEALADLAVIYSGTFVHELTHNNQYFWLRNHVPEGMWGFAFNQDWEREAENAAAGFIKQKRAANPSFAAREARLAQIIKKNATAENNTQDPATMKDWLQKSYSHIPTLYRAAARIISIGIGNEEESAEKKSRLKSIDDELARRSHLTETERLALEQSAKTSGAISSFEQIATSILSQYRATLFADIQPMLEAPQIMLKAAMDLIERTRSELAKFKTS